MSNIKIKRLDLQFTVYLVLTKQCNLQAWTYFVTNSLQNCQFCGLSSRDSLLLAAGVGFALSEDTLKWAGKIQHFTGVVIYTQMNWQVWIRAAGLMGQNGNTTGCATNRDQYQTCRGWKVWFYLQQSKNTFWIFRSPDGALEMSSDFAIRYQFNMPFHLSIDSGNYVILFTSRIFSLHTSIVTHLQHTAYFQLECNPKS